MIYDDYDNGKDDESNNNYDTITATNSNNDVSVIFVVCKMERDIGKISSIFRIIITL